MAYVMNQQDDEEPKNPAQGSVPPGGGAGSAGVQLAPSSGVGSAGGASASSQPGQPAAGGSFATLDKYLSANKGQAEPLANKITSDIGNQYNTLQGQNTSTLNDIGSQVTASSTPNNANAIIAQEAANPVSFAGDQGNVKQFQSLLNASYGGPASAESTSGFTAQQNAINNAIATGQQQTSSGAGRAQLLSQHEAAPSTSVTGLNSAILSQDPNAQSKIENAYKPFSNLLTELSTGAQGIDQNIAQAKQNTSDINTAANKQIADQVNALNSGITQRVNDYTTAQNTNNAALQDFQNLWSPVNTQLNSLNELYKNFGVAPVQNPLQNLIVQKPQNQLFTTESVANPDEAAKGQAFANLLSGLSTGLPAPIATTTGTATAPVTFQSPFDAKQEAASLYKAAVAPQGTYTKQPNGSYSFTPASWVNPQRDQQVNPVYDSLRTLLSNIYGSNIYNTQFQ